MSDQQGDKNPLEFSMHPAEGWIRNKRNKLGITGSQMAAKMGLSKQRISALEKAERSGAASLKSMRQAAEALGCEFVYALMPKAGATLHADIRSPELIVDPLHALQSPHYAEQLTALCQRFEIKHLGLYGAAARGELTADGEINILAEFFDNVPPDMAQLKSMEIQFGRLFGRRAIIASPSIFKELENMDSTMADLTVVYAA